MGAEHAKKQEHQYSQGGTARERATETWGGDPLRYDAANDNKPEKSRESSNRTDGQNFENVFADLGQIESADGVLHGALSSNKNLDALAQKIGPERTTALIHKEYARIAETDPERAAALAKKIGYISSAEQRLKARERSITDAVARAQRHAGKYGSETITAEALKEAKGPEDIKAMVSGSFSFLHKAGLWVTGNYASHKDLLFKRLNHEKREYDFVRDELNASRRGMADVLNTTLTGDPQSRAELFKAWRGEKQKQAGSGAKNEGQPNFMTALQGAQEFLRGRRESNNGQENQNLIELIIMLLKFIFTQLNRERAANDNYLPHANVA